MTPARVLTALVINPNAAQQVWICDALADVGCLDLHLATAEHEALQYAHERTPDVIVLDITGASIDRIATAFPDVPVVAICDEFAIDAAFGAGAIECVAQPIRPQELAARLRAVLRKQSETIGRGQRERKKSARLAALERENHELERLACVDPLTGIANRRHTFALLDAEWRRSAREHEPLGVVMIDLDCYHAYNERYGHLGGDRCLQRVTEAMASCLRRPSDVLGRYGGEEFVAVLPSTDPAGAKIVAERLRTAVESLAITHDASACARVVTITAGFASFRSLDGLSVDKLIATADAALLRAKAGGRNCVAGDAPLVRPTRVSAQAWQRFAPVFADPWYADRIPPFLVEVRDETHLIGEALRAGEHEHVATVARTLEAGAIKLGLFVIGRLAGELAQAPRADIAEELFQYVTHVQVVYRRPLGIAVTERG